MLHERHLTILLRIVLLKFLTIKIIFWSRSFWLFSKWYGKVNSNYEILRPTFFIEFGNKSFRLPHTQPPMASPKQLPVDRQLPNLRSSNLQLLANFFPKLWQQWQRCFLKYKKIPEWIKIWQISYTNDPFKNDIFLWIPFRTIGPDHLFTQEKISHLLWNVYRTGGASVIRTLIFVILAIYLIDWIYWEQPVCTYKNLFSSSYHKEKELITTFKNHKHFILSKWPEPIKRIIWKTSI